MISISLGLLGTAAVAGCFFTPESYPEDKCTPIPENCATPAEDEDCDGHASFSDGDTDCACEPGTTQACYAGPDGTQDVGICRGGIWTCNHDGLGWGSCEGEVTPTAENCGTTTDEDCDGQGWYPEDGCTCEPGTTQPCYTGRANTEGVGTCHGGTQTCNPNGLGWGMCQGEITPTAEVCGNAVLDEDCSGAPCGGDVLWALKAGGSGDQFAQDLAIDSNGNILVVGQFASTLSLGSTTLTSQGGVDAFVAKLDSTGNILWAAQFGDAMTQLATTVAVDTMGNIFVAGYFDGSLTAGATTLTTAGAKDVFVLKLAPGGTVLWAKRFGDDADQRAWGIAVTSSGAPVLTGSFAGSINFGNGGGTNLTSAGGTDVFVARLRGTDGDHVWSKKFGDSANQSGRNIAVGSGVYITGGARGAFEAGNNWINAGVYTDILAIKLDMDDGAPAWGKSFHGPIDGNDNFGLDVALEGMDMNSNVLLTGGFDAIVNFGGPDLTSNGDSNGFVARFNADGQHNLSKALGDSTTLDLISRGIATDASNNVLLTGQFAGTANFGAGNLTSAGANDLFVAKLASNGTHIWNRRFGDTADQIGISVAAAPDDPANPADTASVLVTGYFKGKLDFNTAGTSLTANGASNTLFIAKLAK
jgi:hypothetical protein